MNGQQLLNVLTRQEGLRLVVYDDATGKPIVKGSTLQGNPSIGIGRNLAGEGVTAAEALMLAGNDIARVTAALLVDHPWFAALDPVRQEVLADMAFNMGERGLDEFTTTLGLVQSGQYAAAAEALLNSDAARQLPNRYAALAQMMRTGVAP